MLNNKANMCKTVLFPVGARFSLSSPLIRYNQPSSEEDLVIVLSAVAF